MKILVVYYSLTGNVAMLAQAIADATEAQLLALEPINPINARGFMKYLWGGRQVMMKAKPELKPFDKNPNDFDLIFIGTPVWAWNYCPPLASFIDRTSLKNKQLALFCSHGGGLGKALINLTTALAGNQILGVIDFLEPNRQKTNQTQEQIEAWSANILKLAK